MKVNQNRNKLMSDNLVDGKGHLLKFTFDNNGVIKGVTYLGSESVLVSSLAGIIGLSETYMNQLIERHESGLVENVSEFLSENWAMALYHQWFSEFRFNLKQKLVENPDLLRLMNDTADQSLKLEGFLSRTLLSDKLAAVPEHLRQVIRVDTIDFQDDTLQFIRDNTNHLPMYYVPGTEFK
jgi:hypothetical protein